MQVSQHVVTQSLQIFPLFRFYEKFDGVWLCNYGVIRAPLAENSIILVQIEVSSIDILSSTATMPIIRTSDCEHTLEPVGVSVRTLLHIRVLMLLER